MGALRFPTKIRKSGSRDMAAPRPIRIPGGMGAALYAIHSRGSGKEEIPPCTRRKIGGEGHCHSTDHFLDGLGATAPPYLQAGMAMRTPAPPPGSRGPEGVIPQPSLSAVEGLLDPNTRKPASRWEDTDAANPG